MKDFHKKSAIAVPLDFLMRYTDEESFNTLSQPLTSPTPIVFYFQKNSYLTKRFSDMIQNMMASGLIEYWIRNEKNSKTISNTMTKSEPKVMTITSLKAPFILLLIALSFSFVIFVIEKIYFQFSCGKKSSKFYF